MQSDRDISDLDMSDAALVMSRQETMQRYILTLEFDGAPFVGWQRQSNGLSIQAALEDAIERFCGERVTAYSAGRTDAGVHALAMPAQVDLSKDAQPDVLREALNFYLKPQPIAVLDAALAPADFHVRFSAVARHYRYRLTNRRAPLTLDKGRTWRIAHPLNASAMNDAAQLLVGRHDFTTFRASTCQSTSPVKTLNAIRVERTGDEVVLETSARSFLHHQVRSMVGSLVEVGLGRWTKAEFGSAFAARDRARCGQVAPAEGLYFLKADYP